MNDIDPVTVARTAAEAIQTLAHATQAGTGYTWPSDVDMVIAELDLTATRLQQALRQALNWLQDAHTAGTLGHDSGHDLDATLTDLTARVGAAVTSAARLAADLDTLHNLTAHLTGISDTPQAPGL